MTEPARSWIRCPGCGSYLTGPTRDPAWWECRYHRCGLVFPVGPDSRQRKLTDE